jgi:hypothetical protein
VRRRKRMIGDLDQDSACKVAFAVTSSARRSVWLDAQLP